MPSLSLAADWLGIALMCHRALLGLGAYIVSLKEQLVLASLLQQRISNRTWREELGLLASFSRAFCADFVFSSHNSVSALFGLLPQSCRCFRWACKFPLSNTKLMVRAF